MTVPVVGRDTRDKTGNTESCMGVCVGAVPKEGEFKIHWIFRRPTLHFTPSLYSSPALLLRQYPPNVMNGNCQEHTTYLVERG